MEMKEALKKLPGTPGIYLMKNSLGAIIYVGKAKDLKSRVSQYFRINKDNSPKVNEMIAHIHSFDYITTDTELEALLLECKTIKELKPQYNRLLKNHKGYRYIKVSIQDKYPKISMAVLKGKDDSLYLGPFSSEGSVEKTIEFVRDYFAIRKCTSNHKVNLSECLNFHLGSCTGPCLGNVSQADYRKQINQAILFLEGNDAAPLKALHEKMNLASSNLDFERAANYRDQIRAIHHVLNKQKVIKVSRNGRNLIAVEKFEGSFCKLLLIKGNRLLYAELIDLSECKKTDFKIKLKTLIETFFKHLQKENQDCLGQEDIDEAQIIYSYLRKKSNNINCVEIPSSRIGGINYEKITELLI